MVANRSLVILSLTLAASAAPAGAQFVPARIYPSVGAADPFLPDSRLPGPSVGQEVGALRDRIERARDAGLISRREARRLRREASLVERHAGTYARDGLSASEQAEIESRTRAIGAAIPPARSGG